MFFWNLSVGLGRLEGGETDLVMVRLAQRRIFPLGLVFVLLNPFWSFEVGGIWRFQDKFLWKPR